MAFTQSAMNKGYIIDLAKLFNKCPIEGVVTYDQMHRVIGSNPREKRYLISAALRLANREDGVIVRPINNLGYMRISNGVSVGQHHLDKGRRCHRRGKNIVTNWMAKTNLTDDELRKAYSVVSHLSLVEALAHRSVAPDMSKVDLSTYHQAQGIKDTLAAIKAAKEKGR